MDKPIKTKPHFYAACLPMLQEIAINLGYNLIVHGSMNRDLDLIAIPWNDNPSSHYELIKQLDLSTNGICKAEEQFPNNYMFSVLPGGRSSYVINVYRGGKYNGYEDAQYYFDISITPLIKQDAQ